ncbi:hypothetical protein BDW59DRAFT_110674 [Aspergillus cavernicola]|uniref:Uncharacterized protein n=1 Tax=Aspergillus cavernicola TaxID=176166 RepID=A0ABR4I0U6_9EURO
MAEGEQKVSMVDKTQGNVDRVSSSESGEEEEEDERAKAHQHTCVEHIGGSLLSATTAECYSDGRLVHRLNPLIVVRWPAGLSCTRFAQVTCMATWSMMAQLLFAAHHAGVHIGT